MMAPQVHHQQAQPQAHANPHAPMPPQHPTTFAQPRVEQVVRQVRMPNVADLPVPGQRQVEAARSGVAQQAQSAEAKRMTLLQRLAAVGLGRKDDGCTGCAAAAAGSWPIAGPC